MQTEQAYVNEALERSRRSMLVRQNLVVGAVADGWRYYTREEGLALPRDGNGRVATEA